MSPHNYSITILKIRNEKDFDLKVIKSALPTVVVFMNSWSGNSFLLIAMLEKLASQYKGQFRLLAIDVDKFPSLQQRFSITKTPTTCFFKKGEIVEIVKGVIPTQAIEKYIVSLVKLAA